MEKAMNLPLQEQAAQVMCLLKELPMVRECTLYGSLTNSTADELSDIDIQVDVSGYDNGKFMLELTELLKGNLSICYSDYAPSMIPDKYIVSLAIDEKNPFRMVDISCCAKPHCTTVTRQQAMDRNRMHTHMLKLWTANLKHFARGRNCRSDIVRMAQKIGLADYESKADRILLAETLDWLTRNAPDSLQGFIASCRRAFEQLA